MAPAFIARTVIGMSPYPVTKTIGTWISSLVSSCWKPSPLTPGNRTSSTRQLGPSGGLFWRKSCTDSNVSTRSPTDVTMPLMASRTERSSSITKIVDGSSGMDDLACGRGRQRQPEDDPVRRVGRCRELSSVGFDDRAADREPHAHPFGLGREEGGEEAVEVRRGPPGTRIRHFDEYLVRRASAGGHVQLARSVVYLVHRLDRVEDQIQDHLLELDAIRRNGRHLVRQVRTQPDSASSQLVLREGDDFADCLVHVDAVLARRHLLDERTNAS